VLRRAWSAYLLGDRDRVIAGLYPLRAVQGSVGADAWPAVALGSALLAFTLDRVGEHAAAVSICVELSDQWAVRAPRAHTPAAIRRRLASVLPADSVAARVRETLLRWAMATAHRLPSARFQLLHERDMNHLRSVLADHGESLLGAPLWRERRRGGS
jgi:hypothetical protein